MVIHGWKYHIIINLISFSIVHVEILLSMLQHQMSHKYGTCSFLDVNLTIFIVYHRETGKSASIIWIMDLLCIYGCTKFLYPGKNFTVFQKEIMPELSLHCFEMIDIVCFCTEWEYYCICQQFQCGRNIHQKMLQGVLHRHPEKDRQERQIHL